MSLDGRDRSLEGVFELIWLEAEELNAGYVGLFLDDEDSSELSQLVREMTALDEYMDMDVSITTFSSSSHA